MTINSLKHFCDMLWNKPTLPLLNLVFLTLRHFFYLMACLSADRIELMLAASQH